jgi:hypothetical protein
MADFLLVFRGGDPKRMEHATPEERKTMMEAWGAWFKQLEKSGHLRNPGAALGQGSAVLTKSGKQMHTDTAAAEVKELIGGYSVIAAANLDEAAELAKGAPFLQNNPQGNVLIRPIMEQG